MSNFLNEQTVMQYYVEQIDKNSIVFLQGRDELKADIRRLVVELMEADTMNGKIGVAVDLWKKLFEASMSYISPDKRGYDKIFSYFDAYVEFEELIFASDSFYRDHTLHCIWVYFLGEYVARKPQFEPLFYDSQELEMIVSMLHELIPNNRQFKQTARLIAENAKMKEATRCVAALTHDLGYPLKKIEKINKSIKKVLPYFAVNSFDDFDFEYGNIQQGFIDNFIDLISREFAVNVSMRGYEKRSDEERKKYDECIDKVFNVSERNGAIRKKIDGKIEDALTDEEIRFIDSNTDVEVYFAKTYAKENAYLNDFENYQHGIMSAFLLMKNLNAFQSYNYFGKNDALDTNKGSKPEIMLAMADILSSITDHTSDALKISSINDLNYLTLIDELEEFSRISRASQNREYVKEFCESSIEMKDGWLDIQFVFNNTNLDNLKPELSFKGRCKRFLSLFDIPNMSENLKIRVTVIGELPTDRNTYVLELARKYADISINGESKDIPKYLKSTQYYTKEEYAGM